MDRTTSAHHQAAGMMVAGLRRLSRKALPAAVLSWIARLHRRSEPTPLTSRPVKTIGGLEPISRTFGFDRGTPVDRYYLDRFLAEHKGDIRGRVLEVGDNRYTVRFGGAQVERSDILRVDAAYPSATFVGDLAQAHTLPEAVFDCIVITQTLQFIFDMRAAVATLHKALKPGGVLLLTIPGISQIEEGEGASSWYWSLTTVAARRLLEERFPPAKVRVEAHGNVFAATAFLYGLAAEELDRADLDVFDPSYPVVVTCRAAKPNSR
jgi:SAM-dependent methyltransferase